MQCEPTLNVVVYPEPGPDGDIEQHARDFLKRKNVSGTGGGLGYLVLVAADFDRLWTGVANVDVLGTAAAVPFPLARQATGRHPQCRSARREHVSGAGWGRQILHH